MTGGTAGAMHRYARGGRRGRHAARGRGRGWRAATPPPPPPPPRSLVRATHPAAGDVATAYFVRDARSLRRVDPAASPAPPAPPAPSQPSPQPPPQPPPGFVREGNSLRRVGAAPPPPPPPPEYVSNGRSLRRVVPVLKPVQTALLKGGSSAARTASKALARELSPAAVDGAPAAAAYVVKDGRSLRRVVAEAAAAAVGVGKSASRNRRLDRRKLQHCLFFSKFGRCTQAESPAGCAFIHDPTAIGVCRSWLVGRCDRAAACGLSHAVDRDKMPVCELFLLRRCARPRDACPYLHVSHAPDTPLCEPFALRGFCPRGQACDRVHTWDCLQFVRSGVCERREGCRLRHWTPKRRERAQVDIVGDFDERGDDNRDDGDNDDGEDSGDDDDDVEDKDALRNEDGGGNTNGKRRPVAREDFISL